MNRVLSALIAATVALGACGDAASAPAANTPAASQAAATAIDTPVATRTATTTASTTTTKVSANNATATQLQTAFEAAGVPNASRWVVEVQEYRPYPTNDPTFAKLKSRAELVPTKTTGLTLPMPASGEFTFKLTGQITIHGKTKEVTFDVSAKRSRNELTATATAAPSWKFADFGMTAPSVPFRVVSIVDEIRVAVDLVATVKS